MNTHLALFLVHSEGSVLAITTSVLLINKGAFKSGSSKNNQRRHIIITKDKKLTVSFKYHFSSV